MYCIKKEVNSGKHEKALRKSATSTKTIRKTVVAFRQ